VIKDSGFGHTAFGMPPHQGSLQQLLLALLEEGSATSPPPAAGPADSAAAAAAARVRGFLNKLFNTLNWTLTEFSVSVGDLHSLRGRRSILEAQNQYRRTGLMFELSVNFLRILEFAAVSASPNVVKLYFCDQDTHRLRNAASHAIGFDACRLRDGSADLPARYPRVQS
jgi:Kip1 ubiquitination-promoting complex protein 1